MPILTTTPARVALILAVLASGIVGSTAVASQRTGALGPQSSSTVTTIAQADSGGMAGSTNQTIAVRRKGLPPMVFTDDGAVSSLIKSTRAQIESLEVGLAKDLAHGSFRARQTRRTVDSSPHQKGGSTTDELLSARKELGALKQALRSDLANGEFRAPQTGREVAKRQAAPSGAGEAALANGAVSVSDDVWSLEMAIERDLHAKRFKAIETHFVIDGRRWKTN